MECKDKNVCVYTNLEVNMKVIYDVSEEQGNSSLSGDAKKQKPKLMKRAPVIEQDFQRAFRQPRTQAGRKFAISLRS